MAYTIYKNTNTVLTTLETGEVDSVSTSLDLIGKNVNNYGEFMNNNLVRLLTNSAGTTGDSPRSPQEGQLWYNSTTKRLSVYDGTLFQPTYGSNLGGTQPLTTSTGDFWFDTINSQLNVWDGNEYLLVGPQVSSTLGKFGIEPPPFTIRDQFSNMIQQASVLHSYGSYIGMLTTSSFTMEPSTASIYTGVAAEYNVKNGLTIFNDLEVGGTIYNNGTSIFELPNTALSSYFDLTWCGDYRTTGAGSTATNLGAYNRANAAIRDVLAYVFPVDDYPNNSEVKVVCAYNTSTSVRHFKLEAAPHQWAPVEVYSTSTTLPPFIQTSTNIVVI
jgi:hypothetical protein